MTQEEKEKVNPIFKVGDLISGANSVYRIISLNDELNSYIAVTQDDEEVKIPYFFEGNRCPYHFWSLKDAKECDIITCESGWTCIFKGIHDRVWYSSYCFITAEGEFYPGYYELHNIYSTINGNPSLATKEQQVLFFKRMIEEGYYWDAKNKKVINLQNDKI